MNWVDEWIKPAFEGGGKSTNSDLEQQEKYSYWLNTTIFSFSVHHKSQIVLISIKQLYITVNPSI